jgi:hypothetical protein
MILPMPQPRHLAVFALSLWVSLAPALAQNSYKPACSDTLKQKPAAFAEFFVKRNDDPSELGYDLAAEYWADCQHQANVARLKNYPQLRARLEALRQDYLSLLAADASLATQLNGGGTLYSHGANRSLPDIELHLAKLISLTTTASGAATNSEIQARYRKAQATMAARLKRLDKPSAQDVQYTRLQLWQEASANYRDAYKRIAMVAGPKLDAAGLSILEFVAGYGWLSDGQTLK